MQVKVINECGFNEAVKGIGFSYGIDDFNRLKEVAKTLAHKDGGHNKFLESIVVWIEINAPRYWWQEFDTYRVGTTKQSESTIHTLCKKKLSIHDFEDYTIIKDIIDFLNKTINLYNKETDKNKKELYFRMIKNNLPEGYLQKRMVCTNYKVLRNIIFQRKNHKLKEWKIFIDTVKNELNYPDYLEELVKKENR